MVSSTRIPRILLLATGLLFPVCLFGQTSTNSKLAGGDEKLTDQVRSLSESVRQARLELSESHAEIKELKVLIEQMRNQLSEMAQAASAATPQAIEKHVAGARAGESGAEEAHHASSAQVSPDATRPAAISQDDWELLNAKVDEQHQDKVESGSKFRLKLSGLLLMNALTTSGQVDNLDLANFALPSTDIASHGSTAASLRQSIIGLTGTGPTLVGANTAADLQFDFFGGLPAGYGSAGSGVARIRLARMRFDWENRSIVGGLDTPFFSPNSPTTYVSVAEPGFSTAGNLWVWSPSLRLEQRFPIHGSQVKLEGGFLDPVGYALAGQDYRAATPGESSRQPAYAIRVSATRGESDHALSVGVAGVYTPQRFAGSDTVNGGAAMLDWRVPIKAHLELSGEFFDGKGIDAFGGVAPGKKLLVQ